MNGNESTKNFWQRHEIPDDLLQYFEPVTPEPTSCVVCDPFHGSGTTGVVALRLGRAYIGVDISEEYLHGVTQERMGAGVQVGMGI